MIRARCPYDHRGCIFVATRSGPDATSAAVLAEVAAHLRNVHDDDEDSALVQERAA